MNRGRYQHKPFFKNKVEAAKQKLRTDLHATSNNTGIRHSFTNLDGWEKYAESQYTAKKQKDADDIIKSTAFYNAIRDVKINEKFLSVKIKKELFRFANPKFGPLTIVGSIGDGGRFNIGSAQVRQEFPTLTKAGCLYCSSTPECSLKEAVKPFGNHKMYKIKTKKELLLWDLSSVIGSIDYPNLLDTVRASCGEALWVYIKVPAMPQILGAIVRQFGGDGLIFESTKSPGDDNIALFFDTDDQVKELFSFEEIPFPKI